MIIPNDKEIRSAIEVVNREIDKHHFLDGIAGNWCCPELKILIYVAQAYLSVEGMPEERSLGECLACKTNRSIGYSQICSGCREKLAFNEALRLCKLASVKDKMRAEEEISKIIDDIQLEINSRPQYPNIGKKGCVRRLKDWLAKSALANVK